MPTSLSERVALPVGVRANLTATLALGHFDIVHGFEPGLPSLSSTALLEAETTTAATFLSTERIAVPPRKNQRAKFLARVDVLLGTRRPASSARPSVSRAITSASRSASTRPRSRPPRNDA